MARTQLDKVGPKAYLGVFWQPLCPYMNLEHSQQPARIGCVLVFAEERKPEYPEKNPWSRVENQVNTNSAHI